MLNDIFLRVKNVTTKYISLVIITLILFSISAILGLFLIGTSQIIQSFEDICLNYINKIICSDFNAISFLFSNIFSLSLTFVIFSFLPTNKYTFYITLIIVVYNGYLFGVFLNIFIFKFALAGIITFIFTIFIRYAFFLIATILFLIFSKYIIDKNCNKLKNLFKIALYSYIIAIIGIILEVIMIITLLRPTNLCF